jgi:PleD family two-component response regulator
VATLQADETADVMLTRADIALYDAKSDGRDRVVVAPPSVRRAGGG